MRTFIIALLLFSLLVGAIITNAVYVGIVCNQLSDAAEAAKSAKERDTIISDIQALWDKNELIFNFSIRTNETERMNDLIESLVSSHKAKNEAEFQKYCNLISDLAKEFANYERISLRSIC